VDDVILFCHPTVGDITAVKSILLLFGRASGLLVNYAKSSATLIQCAADDIAPAVNLLGCPLAEFPITYLGLPTWKAHLMNKVGRLAFVKAILSAIPIHQLLALAPPKKTIRALEKIQRGFLWAGRAEANGGHCHVNWQRVARPLPLGGLGVRDLGRTSLALRTRWLWFSRTDSTRAWAGLDLQFTAEERAFFFASTTMQLGNGTEALFWEDRWIGGRSVCEIAPLLYACIPKRRRKLRTVADGL
uniref:Reverse transcriptase domain-containing protein n=1 Tax=Aegilops tauschii subsp. strangulata TaxID=200361 RepID=A0A453EAS1_AEGTS